MKRTEPLTPRHAFAARVLLRHLEALEQQVEGVKQSEEIEPVHRMRVAARRLRNALELFEELLPRGRFKRWRKRVRGVAQSLGAARDVDVQIAFLEEFVEGVRQSGDKTHRAGIERLMLRLIQTRMEMQRDVVRAMEKLESSGVLESMRESLADMRARATLDHADGIDAALAEESHRVVNARLDEMLRYEPYVHSAQHVEELHKMRIAAKHLRYTLEAYAPLYPGELAWQIKLVRQVQSLLGEVHDADVWIAWLPTFVEEERRRHEAFFGHRRGFTTLARGIEYLRTERAVRRDLLYRDFVKFFDEQKAAHRWEALRRSLEQPGPTPPEVAPPEVPKPEARQPEITVTLPPTGSRTTAGPS